MTSPEQDKILEALAERHGSSKGAAAAGHEGRTSIGSGAVMIDFVYDDGGRAAAGFKGDAGDCAVRALAIASGEDYRTVYEDLRALGRAKGLAKGGSPRDGVSRKVYDEWLKGRGWQWTPTMAVGSGCTVHLNHGELPRERAVIVRLSKHLAAVIDGVLYDTHDCSRDGTRCVYGYWTRTGEAVA